MSITERQQNQLPSDHLNRFWNKLASLKSSRQMPVIFENEEQAAYDKRVMEWERPAIVALTRAKHVAKLLHHRHAGPCDTDDGETWLALGLPYVIEAAEILGNSGFVKGLAWARKHCPTHLAEVGFDAVAELIAGMLERHDEAKAAGKPWLPTMPDLVVSLRPTWTEITGLGLMGWGAIDRPSDTDRRTRKTDRQRQARRDRGVAPMASRTKTKDKEALAAEFDVSLRTVERWARAGTLDANVERCRVGKARHRIREEEGRASDFRHSAPPANDNTEQPLPLTETGYRGRHLTLTADQVQETIRRYPNLADDPRAHLDGIDRLMSKTQQAYKRRVFLNLARDRNRRVGSDLRKAA